MLSPENYIKQKARNLPVHECWVNEEWEEDGLANITVARSHTNGNFTVGMYLVDLKCLGVKDAQYYFNMSPLDYRDLMERQSESMEIEKVDYTLVHNIVFAGIEYADDYGFLPHKDFGIAGFILEEDTEGIELMEIDCGGEDGNPLYVRGPLDSNTRAAQIIAQLEKTAGPGNFNVIDGRVGTEWENKHFDDNYDMVPDEEEFEETPLFFDDSSLDFDEADMKNSRTFYFHIQIENIKKPPVWRKVAVPSYYTFLHLHYVIQAAFEWYDVHLFSFSPGGYGTFPIIQENDYENQLFESDMQKNMEASEVKLSEIFHREGQKYTYIYDFGDDWHHKILLEKIVDEISDAPQCLEGKGKCPPEDCGGVWGYESIKEIMSNESHPEYEEYRNWLELEEGEDWDPKEFDLEETQYVLSKLFEKR